MTFNFTEGEPPLQRYSSGTVPLRRRRSSGAYPGTSGGG